MAGKLGIPYFDGTNMDVDDWIHHYSGVLNAKGIYDCVPRLLQAGSCLVGEAHQFWILLDAINKTNEGVYNSNDFCYDLYFRFHPETIEEAREKEEQSLEEDRKLGIPYFDGTNMHVQDWLRCYFEVLIANGVHGCVRKLLVAGSHLVGEAQKYWIELDAIKRNNEGVYNSNDFCYDLCERFDPEMMEEQRIKEAQEVEEILEFSEFDSSNEGLYDLNEFCNDIYERFNPDIMENTREMEETKNMDQILVEIRKLFVKGPQNDGYEHFTDGLCCLFEEADMPLQGSHRTLTCGIALNEVGKTEDPEKKLGKRLRPVREDLPGFTRSVYKKDHALITPESHVFSPLPDWTNTMGAYLITPAMGSHFVMYLAKMEDNSKSGLPPDGVERLVFVVEGSVILSDSYGVSYKLDVDSYAYLPPEFEHSIKCDTLATLVVFERRYASLENHIPEFIVGSTDKQPLLETPGEIFELRKLLPTSLPHDFNIHIMDFQPGEFLYVKEVHYNQHGLLLLEGQGIYRLGDNWYPVQAGDVIWMAPFVPQWYAALGKTRSRYLLYKDVNRNPL